MIKGLTRSKPRGERKRAFGGSGSGRRSGPRSALAPLIPTLSAFQGKEALRARRILDPQREFETQRQEGLRVGVPANPADGAEFITRTLFHMLPRVESEVKSDGKDGVIRMYQNPHP